MRPSAYLHHLQLQSPDAEGLARFYGDALDMDIQRQPDGWLCEGPARLISFRDGAKNALDTIGFACHDSISLAEFARLATSAGHDLEVADTPLFCEGGFAVKDPNGNRIVFGLSSKRNQIEHKLRGPLQHVTLMARNIEAIERFYADDLGFSVSDRVLDGEELVTSFLRCNHEHHTLACFKGPRDGIDHHSYEAGEWNTLRDWADHFARLDIPLTWGPGRHGPGNNLFMFINDPDGNWIELSAELEIIHDRPTKIWPHHPRTLNRWGEARMRVSQKGMER
jgi:catechol-2,3-dioxygenase